MKRLIPFIFLGTCGVPGTAPGLAGCGAVNEKVDAPVLTQTGADLTQCQAEGREANSYAVYVACKKRKGL